MPVTIRDVAEAAGVSVGTVSNVLNKRASVSTQNQAAVLAAMEMLGYNPNYAARALKTGRSGSIGLVIPDIGNPFYPEFARGAEDAARAAGYTLFLCNGDRDEKKEREYIAAMADRLTDGFILYKPHLPEAELTACAGGAPMVLVDASPESYPQSPLVNADDEAGVEAALAHLWGLGHRRIAMIAGRLDSFSARRRVRAFEDFFTRQGQAVPPGFLQYGQYDWHSGYTCAQSLLRRADVPTAIWAANDLMAIGAMKAAAERGLLIPEELSVVGNDDIMMAALFLPGLTTVRIPNYEMGELSVLKVLAQLSGDADPGRYDLPLPELVCRQSTAAPKGKEPTS